MSFFSNFQSDKCPGNISGNALNGLCEKVCLQAKKVFDACIKQLQLENTQIVITNHLPCNPTYPLTFISARSVQSNGQITNLQIDRLPERENCARVLASVTIPLEVIYVDANGVEGKGYSSLTLNQDVILYVPAPSIMPYTVEAVVSAVAPEGTYVGTNTFSISCCVTVILLVVMDVELLVPSYGYCAIPPCQDYSQEMCAGFFELPLFPQGANVPTRR